MNFWNSFEFLILSKFEDTTPPGAATKPLRGFPGFPLPPTSISLLTYGFSCANSSFLFAAMGLLYESYPCRSSLLASWPLSSSCILRSLASMAFSGGSSFSILASSACLFALDGLIQLLPSLVCFGEWKSSPAICPSNFRVADFELDSNSRPKSSSSS